MVSFFNFFGEKALHFLAEQGRTVLFGAKAFLHLFTGRPQIAKTLEQMYYIGAKSLMVILLVGLFTGMVLGLQGYYTLVKFGSEGLLGAAVALSLIRELGPVLTAIMIIARAGSSMAAELGVMRISEQIDALDTMDVDPIRYLVTPRIMASVISFPLLTAFFDVLGIVGGYLTGVLMLGINSGIFFYRMEASVVLEDVTGGFYKSVVFAVLVAVMCCYQGFYTHLRARGFGAVGVSISTTEAVVQSCVLVLVSDYVLTSFLI